MTGTDRATRRLRDALVLTAAAIDEWPDTRHPAFHDTVRAQLHLTAAIEHLDQESDQ